jgi:hypothetical protein
MAAVSSAAGTSATGIMEDKLIDLLMAYIFFLK